MRDFISTVGVRMMACLVDVWTLFVAETVGWRLCGFLYHLPEHDKCTNGQGDPEFSPGPISDPIPSDISKPFLSLFLFPGRFPFTEELVISHCIYCQPGTGSPPTSFQLPGS